MSSNLNRETHTNKRTHTKSVCERERERESGRNSESVRKGGRYGVREIVELYRTIVTDFYGDKDECGS